MFLKCESRSVTFDSLPLHGLYSPWNSPGQNTGVGSLSLLQGMFLTQVSYTAGDSLPAELLGKPFMFLSLYIYPYILLFMLLNRYVFIFLSFYPYTFFFLNSLHFIIKNLFSLR